MSEAAAAPDVEHVPMEVDAQGGAAEGTDGAEQQPVAGSADLRVVDADADAGAEAPGTLVREVDAEHEADTSSGSSGGGNSPEQPSTANADVRTVDAEMDAVATAGNDGTLVRDISTATAAAPADVQDVKGVSTSSHSGSEAEASHPNPASDAASAGQGAPPADAAADASVAATADAVADVAVDASIPAAADAGTSLEAAGASEQVAEESSDTSGESSAAAASDSAGQTFEVAHPAAGAPPSSDSTADVEPPPLTLDEALAHMPTAVRGRVQALLSELQADEWRASAWELLFSTAQSLPVAVARPLYDRFFHQFPASGKCWKMYAEHELREGNSAAARRVFHRTLQICPHLELVRLYVQYVMDTKLPREQQRTAAEEALARASVREAFEFAISLVGALLSAMPLWRDYIEFLRSTPVDASSMKEVTAKRVALRKLYQRALTVPLNKSDQLWREYEEFEMEASRQLARAILTELQPQNHVARGVAKDLRRLGEGLAPNRQAVPPTGTREEREQLSQWKRLLSYELENPLALEPAALQQRVRIAFKRALCCFRYHPELWYWYANTEQAHGDTAAMLAVLQQACDVLPRCLLINLAYADALEQGKRVQEARGVYERLVEDAPSTLLFISFQRFARRAESQMAARKVFQMARKHAACSPAIYVAAAHMEHYANKESKVARNVFELGLKAYPDDVPYITAYLDFLLHQNDETNLRVLFERVLQAVPPEKSGPIWTRFLEFEHKYARAGGSLEAVARVEARVGECFPADPTARGLELVHYRYAFQDIRPDSADDRRFLERAAELNGLGAQGIRRAVAMEAVEAGRVSVHDCVKGPQWRVHTAGSGEREEVIAGKRVRIPPMVAKLLALLPPPGEYAGKSLASPSSLALAAVCALTRSLPGPRPDVTELFGRIGSMQLPPRPAEPAEQSQADRVSAHALVSGNDDGSDEDSSAEDPRGRKRRAEEGPGEVAGDARRVRRA